MQTICRDITEKVKGFLVIHGEQYGIKLNQSYTVYYHMVICVLCGEWKAC